MSTLTHLTKPVLEQLKKIDQNNNEYWSARDIGQALGYVRYAAFVPVIRKAMLACRRSHYKVKEHFQTNIEATATREGKKKLGNIYLSRLACYLVIQNANPAKEMVALNQLYIATQCRKQEITQYQFSNEALSPEDLSRLLLRNEMIRHNKELAKAAKRCGVIASEDFSNFQNRGYQGLYGGLDQRQIHKRKGLKKNQKTLDYMGSTELAANLFRITQTEEKLIREPVKDKYQAFYIHQEVGRKIRQLIEALQGILPENLRTPEESVKAIEHRQKK